MICSLGSSRQAVHTNSHLVQMIIMIILTILCRFVHQNNTSYIPLVIGFYLYSAGACVDVITLLNHLELLVSYDALQKKLRKLSHASK